MLFLHPYCSFKGHHQKEMTTYCNILAKRWHRWADRRHCSSSDLFLSWEWEWSSWDPFSFSPSSLCETRRKWTPYSTVHYTLQHRSVNCRWSLVCFTVPPLCVSSICGVFLHLPGGSDERFGAGWVHLRLHGLLREEGKRRTCTKPSTTGLNI